MLITLYEKAPLGGVRARAHTPVCTEMHTHTHISERESLMKHFISASKMRNSVC